MATPRRHVVGSDCRESHGTEWVRRMRHDKASTPTQLLWQAQQLHFSSVVALRYSGSSHSTVSPLRRDCAEGSRVERVKCGGMMSELLTPVNEFSGDQIASDREIHTNL
jgi:hypothetical protein